MNDLMQLIQEADLALVQMDQAKSALDAAKLQYEMSKEEFDRVLGQADQFGIARAKLKKLAEERSAALMASGLLSTPITAGGGASKTPRAKTAKKSAPPPSEEMKHLKEMEQIIENTDETELISEAALQ